MSMLHEMMGVATECLNRPGTVSVWSSELGKYVCVEDPGYKEMLAKKQRESPGGHSPINPAFKLVFLAAAGGTILFVLICVAVTIIAGRDMPPPLEKLITGMFDLAKIGFGAVVGLLGSRTLLEDSQKRPRNPSSDRRRQN